MEQTRLSLDEIGTAECSAGLFDMIDVDKKLIKQNRKALADDSVSKKDALYNILFSASRMLLVTRGLDIKDEVSAFKLFQKHFITTGLVSSDFSDLVALGERQEKDLLDEQESQILALADAVETLYKNMDDSLRFKSESGDVIEETETPAQTSTILEHDFRGVGCPMNFVKTKLVLATMKSRDLLKIYLDDGEPIQNVPNSVELEGHKVLSKIKVESYWEVLIQKA